MKFFLHSAILAVASIQCVFSQFSGNGPSPLLPDPYFVEEAQKIDVTMTPFFKILDGSTISGLKVTGLSGFKYSYSINANDDGAFIFNFEATVSKISMNASDYTASGTLDFSPLNCLGTSGAFSGYGEATGNGLNWKIQGSATISVNDNGLVNMDSLTISTWSFDELYVNLGPHFKIAGKAFPPLLQLSGLQIVGGVINTPAWDAFATTLKICWDETFLLGGVTTTKDQFVEKLRQSVNVLLNTFTFDQLVAKLS